MTVSRETEDRIREVAARYDSGNGEGEALAETTLARLEWRKEHGGKVCSTCREAKAVGEFGPDADKPDGLAHRCRECDNARKREARRVGS